MPKVEIYGLLDPISKTVMYVGKANDSQKRLKSHISDSKARNTPVYQWIRGLNQLGMVPIVDVLTITDTENWKQVERCMIKKYREINTSLLNVANGGDEPFCSKEQRAINGAAVSLAIHSNPRRKKLWSLKKKLAVNLKFLESHGREESCIRIRKTLSERGIYL